MKIQSLAIIFMLIILPISIVLSEYVDAQHKTFALENMYDSRLVTATSDALKAFQDNTFNDTNSDIADSKLNSIEASANVFYTSMESSFGLQGYAKEDLQRYTPALVYTMYDGYYIYSPYANIATTSEENGLEININVDDDETQFGFKPYVYYSCRYKPDSNSDFVITYSLDNYISVVGIVDGEYLNESGYLISNISFDEETSKCIYNGIEITAESALEENLVDDIGVTNSYKYIKINGTKYYLDETPGSQNIFYILNGTKIKQATKSGNEGLYNKYKSAINNNTSALSYYRDAYEFTKLITTTDVLKNLKAKDAVDSKGNNINLSGGLYTKIFDDSVPFEYPNSNFNLQRKEVIRHSIESNLSIAIANFNKYSNSTNDFQMPKLKETDWELLQNQISIVSFLQGLNIGGKVYNGYTVVTNNKTEELVKEEDIVIIADDRYYHRVNEINLPLLYPKLGVLDIDFEIKKDSNTGEKYLPRTELASYSSIITQNKVNNSYNSIYEYLDAQTKTRHKDLEEIYYTALARERWGTYKTLNGNTIDDLIEHIPPEEELPTPEEIPDIEPVNPIPKLIITISDENSTSDTKEYKTVNNKITISKKITCSHEVNSIKYVVTAQETVPAKTEWNTCNSGETININKALTKEQTIIYLHVKVEQKDGSIKEIKSKYTINKQSGLVTPTPVVPGESEIM